MDEVIFDPTNVEESLQKARELNFNNSFGLMLKIHFKAELPPLLTGVEGFLKLVVQKIQQTTTTLNYLWICHHGITGQDNTALNLCFHTHVLLS